MTGPAIPLSTVLDAQHTLQAASRAPGLPPIMRLECAEKAAMLRHYTAQLLRDLQVPIDAAGDAS